MSIYSIGGSISGVTECIIPCQEFSGIFNVPDDWTGFSKKIVKSLTDEQKDEFKTLFKVNIEDYDFDSLKNLSSQIFIDFIQLNCPSDTYYVVEIPWYLFNTKYCAVFKDRDVYANISGLYLNFDGFIVDQIKLIIENEEDLSLIERLIGECEFHKKILIDNCKDYNIHFRHLDIIQDGTALNF